MNESLISIIRSDGSVACAKLVDGIHPWDLWETDMNDITDPKLIFAHFLNTEPNTDEHLHWLRKMAEIEDSCESISVGGMLARRGLISPVDGESQHDGAPPHNDVPLPPENLSPMPESGE